MTAGHHFVACRDGSDLNETHSGYLDVLTWTRGSEHRHGISVMMLTAVTLNEFSLAL